MLNLVLCEFWKLKRKKITLLVILSAFLFPIPLAYFISMPRIIVKYIDKKGAFDGLFNIVLGSAIEFLLPCIIGIIAIILFFTERDNDTFKNLKTIPLTSTKMIYAKIFVLFVFGIIFSIFSMIATIISGSFTTEVNGLLYKFGLEVVSGIFVTAATLPLIVLIVFFSRNYIFSILICIFYSILNLIALALYNVLPRFILWVLPMPLIGYWSSGNMAKHGIKVNLKEYVDLIPTTGQVILVLSVIVVFSFIVIDYLYKYRGE